MGDNAATIAFITASFVLAAMYAAVLVHNRLGSRYQFVYVVSTEMLVSQVGWGIYRILFPDNVICGKNVWLGICFVSLS